LGGPAQRGGAGEAVADTFGVWGDSGHPDAVQVQQSGSTESGSISPVVVIV
jgi:hypothetical protein